MLKRFWNWLFPVRGPRPTGDPLDDEAFMQAVFSECMNGKTVFGTYNPDGTYEMESVDDSEDGNAE